MTLIYALAIFNALAIFYFAMRYLMNNEESEWPGGVAKEPRKSADGGSLT